jgi:hypothetical protein
VKPCTENVRWAESFNKYLDQTTEEQRERSKGVFTTWELSFQSLRPETDIGAKKSAFLSLLGFFNYNDISEEFFRVYHSKMMSDPDNPVWLELFTDLDNGLPALSKIWKSSGDGCP